MGEIYQIDTAMDPWSCRDYSRITAEAGMVMKKSSGDDFLLRQGAGKSSRTLPN
jgi:hypothetical protein